MIFQAARKAARWLAWCALFCLAQAQAEALVLRDAQVTVPGAAAAQAVRLPHEWEATLPGFSGTLDYRLRFPTPAGPLLAVFVERACTNLEVRVNGELVGTGGRMEPPITRNCYFSQLFPLPRSLLREQGNELHIRVAGFAAMEVSARQRAGGLSAVRVGELAELQALHDTHRFWNVTVAQIIATSVAGLGLGMLALWNLRRQDRYLLFFGLFTTGWALISTRLFLRDIPLPAPVVEVLICSVFPPVVGCAFLFLMRLVERRWAWMDRALLAQAVAAPIALALAAPDRLLPVATTVYNALALEFLVCVVCFFVLAWREHRDDFWLIGAVLVIAVVFSAAEIALQNDWLPLPRVHLIHFVMPLIFIVIGIRLIQLFVRALRDAETLNQQLELRVEEKSREIERDWQQIARLQTALAAQDERRRIASDLHDDLGAQLLTIAQASQRAGEHERVAGMARQALEEMRLSVRGLTGHATSAGDLLADWRAETMTRLADARIEGSWEADAPGDNLVLPARAQVQLTRILREAVSNAIRHSGCRRCAVHVRFPPGRVVLVVEDDGRGITDARDAVRAGHGLPNIERRARHLGGEHRFEVPPGGGTRLVVAVPLPATTSAWGMP